MALALALAVLLASAIALFAVAEAALAGLSRSRHQHLLEREPERYQRISDFLETQDNAVFALGLARTTAVLAAVVLGASLAWGLPDYQQAAILAGLALAVLLLGHALPRAIVTGRPEEVAVALAVPIRAGLALFSPLSLFGLGLTRLIAQVLRRPAVPEGPVHSADELREVLGERLVEEDEREMIDGIFDLEEKTAHEIMVPRMDVVALDAATPVRDALDVFIQAGFSRLPVYDGRIDDVVGILYAKDLFPLVRSGQLEGQVRELVRPAYFIPESKKIDELLRELQQRRVHIAIVVDEYGGTAGLVTIEDLLEEIVGEIQDEFDLEEAKIVEGREGEAVFDATVSIGDVNDTLDLELRGEEVDTIGGLVYERLGKVPLVGDQIDAVGATVTVLSTKGRRIRKVRVTRSVPSASGANGGSPPEG